MWCCAPLLSVSAAYFDTQTCLFSQEFYFLDLELQIVHLPPCSSGWAFFLKKWKERESRAQRMHKTVVTFVFKKKRKNLKVFLFSSALAFMKTDKGQICYFPSEKAKGALIFSLPIPEWIIIVRLLWVTMCSVARFTFKWNQMAVHSEMIYSNDHGNKSKVLFHIGPAPTRDHCHLGTLQVQSVSYVFAMSRLLPSHFNEWIHQHAA